jgi:hypothetical protein
MPPLLLGVCVTDNTPTERLDSLTPQTSRGPSRGVFIGLIGVGSAIVIALVILIILLMSRPTAPLSAVAPSPTPSTSPSSATSPEQSPAPSAAASPEPTAAPPKPPSTAPAFSMFSAPSSEGDCYYSEAPAYTPPSVYVKVKWKAVNAESVWFVQGTSDAADSMFMEVPLAGSQDDFPYPFDFQCSSSSNTYTMTIVGKDGTHKSKTWKVKNTGDRY